MVSAGNQGLYLTGGQGSLPGRPEEQAEKRRTGNNDFAAPKKEKQCAATKVRAKAGMEWDSGSKALFQLHNENAKCLQHIS